MPHLNRHQTLLFAALVTVSLLQTPSVLVADETTPPLPLSQQIDQLVARSQTGPVSALADDTTFLRRVSLDLIGRIPTISETKAFLTNDNPEKREELVDDLLSRPDFYRHMAVTFDTLFMERRGGTHVKGDEFRSYLEQSFREGKSYRQLVKEILAADGTDEKTRAASAFYLERDVAPDLLTREIGRTFFGVDLQCAQCHNHPNIEDYHQEDYYGLHAFVVRASLFRPDNKKPAVIAEKAEGEATFQSVFTNRASMTGPRPPLGDELVEVSLKPGERYIVEPAKDVRPIPKISRLAKLSEVVTENPTPAFNRNIANRLWAHMLGRGIVHPVDLHHSGNPPTHPALLDLIANAFAAGNYDVKSFLREIALCQTYQRSPQLENAKLPLDQLKERVTTLEGESKAELELSYSVDSQVEKATETLDAAITELKPLSDAINAAEKTISEALKVRDAATTKLAASQKSISEKQTHSQLISTAHEAAKLAVAALPKDTELAAATATLAGRLASVQAEVAKLQEGEQAEISALSVAEEKLQGTRTTADTALAAAQPVEEKIRALRSAQIQLRSKAAQHRLQSTLAKQQASEFKVLIEHAELQTQIQSLAQQVPVTEQSLKTAQGAIPTYEQALETAQSVLTTATAAHATTQTAVTIQETKLTEVRSTKNLLSESLTKLEAAIARLSGENKLATAKTEITTSIQTVTTEVTQQEAVLSTLKADLDAKVKLLATAGTEHKTAQTKLAEHKQQTMSLAEKLQQEQLQLHESRQAEAHLWETIVEQSTMRLNTANVIAMTPEQLGWSVLTASGQRDRQRVAEAAKLNKEKPLSEEDLKDPAKVASREAEIDELTYQTLSKSVIRFVQLFGAGAGQPQTDFFATADQALFFANGGELNSWLSPSGGNLTDRLVKLDDPAELSKELYLSLFCREPATAEIEEVSRYLSQRADAKPAAVQELAWGLITSVEFRFQY